MSGWVRGAVLDRLHGVHIHVDPLVAVDGLCEEDARRVPFRGGRSALELLFHIVFWQDYSLGLLRGEVGEYVKDADWGVGEESWGSLVERFTAGHGRLEFIAENWELDEEVKISDDLSTCVGAEVLGTAQHTSYHLGQLVSARRALGVWYRS